MKRVWSKLLAGWWLFWSCVTGIRGALPYLAISLWRPPLRRDTRICLYSLTGDETFCLALGLFLDDDEYQQIYWEPERKKIFGYLKWRSTLYVIFTTQHFEHKLVFNRGSKRWDLESGLKTPWENFLDTTPKLEILLGSALWDLKVFVGFEIFLWCLT